jgi:hypothetical protein
MNIMKILSAAGLQPRFGACRAPGTRTMAARAGEGGLILPWPPGQETGAHTLPKVFCQNGGCIVSSGVTAP